MALSRLLLIPALFAALPALASFEPPSPEQASQQLLESARARYAGSGGGLESAPGMPEGSQVLRDHIVFEKWVDAYAWIKATQDETKLSFNAKRYEVLKDHKDQAKLQGYVDELWAVFRILFPEQTEGLSAPHVIVADTEQTTAFVPSHEGLSLHLMVVMTGMIEKAGGVDKIDEITGNLAHEIAHSVFSHGSTSHVERIQRFFVHDDQLLGFESGIGRSDREQKALDELNRQMESYIASARNIGEITHEDLLDLPSPSYGTPLLQRVWAALRNDASLQNKSVCAEESRAYGEWSKLLPFTTFAFKHKVIQTSATQLRAASDQLVARGEQCFAGRQNALAKHLARLLGVSESALNQDPQFRQMNQDFVSAIDPLSGLRKIVRDEREGMRKIEQKPFFSQLGYYTVEQHADDASALVHGYLGRDPGAFGKLLRISMSRYDKAHPAMCDALRARGEVPEIGSFLVLHHGNCYRIWNFSRMTKRLQGLSKDQIRELAQEFLKKSARQ